MKVIYTKHAEEKLTRYDIKKFKISKALIRRMLLTSSILIKTKYGDSSVVGSIDPNHILRVIYVIINSSYKVITFHVARKGRYEN